MNVSGMSAYLAIKHLHVACVAISAAGFFLRGVLMLADAPILRTRAMRIAPHVNDSILLAAAIALAAMSGQYPFVTDWVTAKVFGLIVYIILGAVALKAGRSKPERLAAWLGALLVLGYIVSVARSRDPLGFLSGLIG